METATSQLHPSSILKHLLIGIFLFITTNEGLRAQSPAYPKVWMAKVNLLSPVWGNLSGEVEYMAWDKASLFAGGGSARWGEDAYFRTEAKCTEDKGVGLYVGGKYFFKSSRSEFRTIDGWAIKGFLGYQLNRQDRQLCPSLLPWNLEIRRSVSLNAGISYQKTFFDRLLFEAQAGLGGAFENIAFANPEFVTPRPNYNRLEWTIPICLHVGYIF